ncbi:sugar transporter [Nitzschia inconspicua]|uniref:Hexose transporter 1 n=1 Tax=Nitzschia inconspicua TaxID=303405 RepID=A0A9K3PEA3_9STRA|nr:sugar transporter [Nitzschia inconspicua]
MVNDPSIPKEGSVSTEQEPTIKSLDIDEENPSKENGNEVDIRTKGFVVVVAIAAALGGLIFGYDIGGAGATFVMDGFRLYFGWDCPEGDDTCVPATESQIDTDQGLVNGLFGAGAAIGAIVAPKLFDSYGRKVTMYTASWTFVIGATLQAAAVNMTMLQVPRLLSGAGIGALSMCSPVYIGELAPVHHRGQLATLWQMAIVTGIVLVSILNLWLKNWSDGWRISYGGNVVFALILIGMLTIMPESPRYLVGKEKYDEARKALQKVRFEDQMDEEMKELELEAKAEVERGVSTWAEIFDNDNRMRYRILLGIGLQSIQQLSGINAIMFYAPRILENFFGSSGGIVGALILNVINFFATFITIATVESFGRAKLLFSGGILMCFSLLMTAIFASLEETKTIGFLIVVFCGLYVVGFAYSWGPVVWVYCCEIYPLRSRGKATGLTTLSNWTWTTIVGAVFPYAATASLTGCFAFFAGIVFVSIFVVYFYLPETANRTILEIDEDFKNHKPEFPRKKWN